MENLKCPDCGADMVLRTTNKFPYKDGQPRRFYGCSRWPDCSSAHGAHPDGTPLGTPATHEVKQLRIRVHRLCDRIWGDWKTISHKRKREMYAWLEKHAPKTHIASMNKEELLETERLLRLRVDGNGTRESAGGS